MPRQAIIVTNPKWERFTVASDAFKKLTFKEKESAVLVERGRSKERSHLKGIKTLVKNKPDSPEALAADLRKEGASQEKIDKAVAAFKPLKSAAVALLLFGLMCLPSFAQNFITDRLPATELAGATTNAGPGSGIIGWNRDQIAVIGANLYSTNNVHASTKSNVFVRFDTSANGVDWTNNAYFLTLVTATFQTNGNAHILRFTNSLGAKWVRIGQIENANTNRVYFQRLSFDVDP